jgi:hypothetical protein
LAVELVLSVPMAVTTPAKALPVTVAPVDFS